MQAYSDNKPFGEVETVAFEDIAPTARRMFESGADEVRISATPGKPLDRAKRKARNKMARQSRRNNR